MTTREDPKFEHLDPEFRKYLVENGYELPVGIPGDRWVALLPFMFTTAIVMGRRSDLVGYDQRWCYHNPDKALGSLLTTDWSDPSAEPDGWHRHLPSMRRRDENGNEEIRE